MVLATPVIARPAPVLTGRVLGAVALLGVAGTGLAYVWNTAIVNRWGATNASTVTYLTPLVGVVLGVVVLGENASWNLPVGALVVITGVLVAQDRLGGLLRRAGARRGRRRNLPETGDSAVTVE